MAQGISILIETLLLLGGGLKDTYSYEEKAPHKAFVLRFRPYRGLDNENRVLGPIILQLY